jgi:hypothetical protein
MEVEQEVRRLTASLVQRHPLFSRQTVERLVVRTFDEFAGATVKNYVPILVERAAEARLRELDGDYAGERAPAPFSRVPGILADLSASDDGQTAISA